MFLPLAFAGTLASLAAIPRVAESARLFGSFLGAAGALLVWAAILIVLAQSRGRTLGVEVVLKKQHYIQALTQAAVLLYWGWYWREVYHSFPQIVAQLLLAYAFDALLVWSLRDTYTLGFAPFPIVFSINLFLWFKPDWFYLQFAMVAAGFAGKELVHWKKDGRQAHVFNPSSLPLALFSAALIATGSTRFTWGPEIATTLFYAPFIYPFIFAVGLVGQYLFGITAMTMSAALTMYLFGRLYLSMTGRYYFRDEYIPVAVFLGMHLLFTDPSTSPKTELGRILFGVLYAAGVVLFHAMLGAVGAPTFYDKLLPVPLLNVTVRFIDRVVRSTRLGRLDPGNLGRSLPPGRRNLAYMAIWSVAFVVMSVEHAPRPHPRELHGHGPAHERDVM
jgi:hypothetical protein